MFDTEDDLASWSEIACSLPPDPTINTVPFSMGVALNGSI